MALRAWLFRSFVCVGLAAIGAGGWIAYLQTNSDAVRARVVEQIRTQFPDIDVQVGSAWIRPLGGLWMRDVRLARRDDPGHPFLTIPSVTIYHDKEKLAQGRLVLRKIELVQPLLHIRRDADGKWNLPARPREGRTDELIPTLIVRQGTIQCEDRVGGQQRPVLEMNDVSWTSVNDPLPRMKFEGQGVGLLGPVKWSGTLDRPRSLVAAVIELPQWSVTPEIAGILGLHCADVKEHLAGFEGRGDARLELQYQPGSRPALKPVLQVNVRNGSLRHPKIPLSPLEGIDLAARYQDGRLVVERCRARSGQTNVTVELEAAIPQGTVRFDDPEQFVERFHLGIENLTLSRELFEQLPPNLKEIHRDFKPNGPIGLILKIEKRDRRWSQRWIAQARGISAEFVNFPYPIEALRGQLEQITDSDGKGELLVNLTGSVAGGPVVIEGTTSGSGSNLRMDLRIRGNRLPADETLMKALGEKRAAVEAFHPVGWCSFSARIRQSPGDVRSDLSIQLQIQKLAVCYDDFPYPLENLTGTLRVYIGTEKRIVFENFVGTHHGAEVCIDGDNRIGPTGHVVKLKVRAAGIPVDGDLARALTHVEFLKSTWHALRPGGRLGFDGEFECTEWTAPPSAPKPAPRRTIVCRRFDLDSLLPDFLPYELTNVSGAMRFADGRVEVSAFKAWHRGSQVTFGRPEYPCLIVRKPGGGLWARVQALEIKPLVPDEELLCALPARLRGALASLEGSGPMALSASQFIIDTTADRPEQPPVRPFAGNRGARMSAAELRDEGPSPWMYWEGVGIRLAGASLKMGLRWENVHGVVALRGEYRNGRLGAVEGNLLLDQATVLRQPVQNVHAQLVIDPAKAPGVLQIKNLKARMFGGDIGGEASLMLEPVLRYDVRLNALGLRLEEIDRHNKITPDGQLAGRAEAQLYLAGEGDDLSKMRGGGLFHVPKGRIYSLPPLLDLLKFLKFHTPDGTFFDEAYARFRIQGKHAHVEQFDLTGNLISLTGDGVMDFDGSNLKMDVYLIWSRLVQLLPGPVREVPNSISRNLYKIEMTGSLLGRLDFQQEAVPFLVEPVKRLLERMQPSTASAATVRPPTSQRGVSPSR